MSEPISRAWDNKNKRWLDSFFINQKGEVYSFAVDASHNYQMGACIINHSNKIDAVLCRSTRRKDKDDIEIFQNDVVSLSFGIPPTLIKFLVCEDNHGDLYLKHINNGGADSSINTINLEKKSITLLGSSLDNPELLEKKQ